MTQEQNILVEKMIKKDQNNPSPSHYMLNPMLYAILELILWHKYKTRMNIKKPKKREVP